MDYTEKLFEFIKKSPTSFHAVKTARDILTENGFTRLSEGEEWDFGRGEGYFVTRASSLIAFRIPEKAEVNPSFSIVAAHCDSPAFKLKENPEIKSGGYVTLNTEVYGGMIMSSWMDRPLSVAGRLTVKKGDSYLSKLVNIDRDLLVIPNLAIHMDRTANSGKAFNPRKDTLPLFCLESDGDDIISAACDEAGEDRENVVGYDLFLYPRQRGCKVGSRGQFIVSPRLDDLMCAYAGLAGLLGAKGEGTPVLALFDNEEVGSVTRSGAGSTFLRDVLDRICALSGGRGELPGALAGSFMLSADNAHALHPNAPRFSDPANRPVLNGGVVIKYAASGRYVTDGLSRGILKGIMTRRGLKYQIFHNRSDLPGGATLGNISNGKVPLLSADVGIAQLAMHSAVETAGSGDLEDLVKLCARVFSHRFEYLGDGGYKVI